MKVGIEAVLEYSLMDPSTIMEPKGTGAYFSPHDYRDGYAAAATVTQLATVTLPATYQTELDSPLMQNQVPACVAHDAVDNLKVYWFRKTGKWINFSPRFLDIMAKRFDGADRATGGTYPRLVFKIMATYGCATDDMLPNDTTLPVLTYRDDSLITAEVLANAAQYKTPGYVSIPGDKQSTRAAIFVYGIISGLFEIGSEFWLPSWKDKDIDPLRTPAMIVSGHQLGLKGWASDALNTLRNEWSALWANNGEANYDHVDWQPYVREQWAIAEIPPDVADLLKTLPAPADFHHQWQTNMSLGDFSDDVRFLQIALMITGFLGQLTPDELGHFGPKTAVANGKYQIAHRIGPVPNSAGPQTRAALNAQFAL